MARLCSRSRDDILGVRIPNEDDNGNSPMVFRCFSMFKMSIHGFTTVFLYFIHGMILWNEVGWSSTKLNLPNPSMGPGGQTQLQGHSYLLMITPPTGSNHHLLRWIFPFLSIFHVWKNDFPWLQDCTWHGQASLRAKRRILSRNLQVLRAPKVRPSALRRWDGHHFTGKTSSLHDSVLPFYIHLHPFTISLNMNIHLHSFTSTYLPFWR